MTPEQALAMPADQFSAFVGRMHREQKELARQSRKRTGRPTVR